MAKVGDLNVPLLPTLLLVTGGYLTWFGVHYWRDVNQAYPSGPVKALLTGQGLPAPVREGGAGDPNAAADTLGAIAQGADTVAQGANQGLLGGATPGPGIGGTYTQAGLQALWISNGGDPAYAGWASAIAEAESSGDPESKSSNPDGGTNYGIWQLDTKGVGAGYTVAQLQDPDQSTKITVMATRNGVDWSDWGDPVTSKYGYTGIKNFSG
jgi:hypothetical protein